MLSLIQFSFKNNVALRTLKKNICGWLIIELNMWGTMLDFKTPLT